MKLILLNSIKNHFHTNSFSFASSYWFHNLISPIRDAFTFLHYPYQGLSFTFLVMFLSIQSECVHCKTK